MNTQEKIEEFWGKCFHPATKVVYTTDHYKVGKEEFISIVSGFINQARKEGAIEELEKLEEDYNIVFVADGNGGHQREEVVLIDKLQDRIKALKEGK